MTQDLSLEHLAETIDKTGILLVPQMDRFFSMNEDFSFPHIVMTLCLSGNARAMYDMREITHKKK